MNGLPTPLDRIMREQGRQSQWLAKQVRVSAQLVGLWRSGKRRITEAHRPRVAAALNVPVDELGAD